MKSALSVSFLFVVSLSAQAPTGAGTVRIGTWNLEFLGAEGNYRNNLPVRDDQDLAKIGQKVCDMGVAVLAVQEVCGSEPLRKVAAGAGPSWQFVLGTSGGWDDGKISQQIGFLWNEATVELLFAEELLQLPREAEGVPIFHRVPVTAAFRVKATGFDFRATTVHLKAGQKADDEKKRRLEATELARWFASLQSTSGEDQDRVLLGDFNSSFGAAPETILEKDGLLTYLQPRTPAPTIMHFADPIDQIVVGPGFAELRADTFTVHGDFGDLTKDAWRKIYSDHFPVTADLVGPKDEDPDAAFRHGGDDQSLPPKNRPAIVFPAAKAAAETAAPPARTNVATDGWNRWPPAVGTQVVVHVLGGQISSGRLRRPMPEGPGGWLVVETAEEVRAIPWERIEYVALLGK